MHFLNRMSIRDRLAASLPIVLILFSTFGLFTAFQSSRLGEMTQDLHTISKDIYGAALMAAAADARINEAVTELFAEQSAIEMNATISKINDKEDVFLNHMKTISSSISLKGDERGHKLVEETTRSFYKLKSIRDRAISSIEVGESGKAAHISKQNAAGANAELEMNLRNLSEYGANRVELLSSQAKKAQKRVWHVMLAFIAGFALFSLFLLHLILNSVMTAITRLQQAMGESARSGNLIKAELVGKNEVVEMAQHYNELVDKLNEQLWLRGGLNYLNSDLSGGIPFQEIARKSVSLISRHVNACAGALYSISSTQGLCALCSSFALNDNQHFAKEFMFGEGIVGQVAVERRSIFLENISSNTGLIKSGSFAEAPKCIYVVPLVYHDDLYGIFEFAFFKKINPAIMEFLDSAGIVIASFLYAAQQRGKIRELLNRSQESNEQLQLKSDELNAANEEMAAVNEELLAQTEELQAQAEELKAQTGELERQRSRAEEADRLKSEFLSNMSHELRTPLNSVMALSQLMISRGVGKNPEQEQEYLKVIERNGRQLLTLINDILDLSKIESGRMDLRQSEFDPKAAAENAVQTIRPMADAKELDLDIILEDVGSIYSDKDKVHQILLNLLSNAVKFTENGSVSLSLSADINSILFTITDTGIGIPEKNLENIFDEFRQVDGSLTRRHEGTGLGLAICKRLAALLAGNISVKSTVGRGTKVTLTLPRHYKGTERQDAPKPGMDRTTPSGALNENDCNHQNYRRAASQKAISPQAELPGSKPGALTPKNQHTILLIDDNEKDRTAIKELFAQAGYKTLEAEDGEKGLKLALDQHPSVILLDVMMPDMDGWEVLSKLKADKGVSNIPVIIASISKDRSTAEVLGAVDCVMKPINQQQLLKKIASILGKEKSKKPENIGPNILLVEDNDVASLQIRLALEENGYKVQTAVNGTEAMIQMGNIIPDAIILDLMMPEVDGFQLLDWIRATPSTNEVPILIVTAKELSTTELTRLANGNIQELAQKGSIDREQLVACVERMIKKDKIPTNIEINKTNDFTSTTKAAHGISNNLPRKKECDIVLVVEDNPDNRFTITAILNEIGCKHETAVDGEEAVAMAKKIKPRLILMDINLPKLSGLDASKAIKADPSLQKIPIVALTAKAMKGDRQEIINAGCDDYLSKPVDPTEVMTMVLKWMA